MLLEQQKYMFQNNTHKVKDRIVAIHQPFVRPIVRGKVKNSVEFGAKYEVLVDENGIVRMEKYHLIHITKVKSLLTA